MGPSGGEGAVDAGLGLFMLVRRSAGQGHGHKPARDPAPLRYVGVRPRNRSPVDGPPSSAHSGQNHGGRTIQPSLRAGRAFARIPENRPVAAPRFTFPSVMLVCQLQKSCLWWATAGGVDSAESAAQADLSCPIPDLTWRCVTVVAVSLLTAVPARVDGLGWQ